VLFVKLLELKDAVIFFGVCHKWVENIEVALVAKFPFFSFQVITFSASLSFLDKLLPPVLI
jgi:hypothetical protein